MKFFSASVLFIAFHISTITLIKAQDTVSDTLFQLPSASVRAYLSSQPYLELASSVGMINRDFLNLHQGNTLLPALNTIPGIRMEERSPGSYRLSIRGSLLRSPFGVRNVKIYLDELPLTDASGNTYLNSLDPGTWNGLTILKGPDGSLFGANSGGVVLMSPNGMQDKPSPTLSLTATVGSYGLFNQQLSGNYQINEKYRFSLDYAHQQSDGYRENTASSRHYLQTVQRFQYNKKNELRFIGFYSSMNYKTPGGLTAAQYLDNPKQARPAAGPNPGAVEQQAAIYNNTLFGGLIHEWQLTDRLKHVVSIFGTYTDFTNPFITNYEKRYENNAGFRSYLSYANTTDENFRWHAHAGVEWQEGKADILNFDNNQGSKGAEQAGDALKNHQHFYFGRLSAEVMKRLNLEGAISVNYYNYAYKGLFPQASTSFEQVSFSPTWMPRFALSYLINQHISWRLSSGKGFSPPTSAEVRSSDKIINTALRPETGWNNETGIRWQSTDNRFQLDASVFSYNMRNAIVRLVDEDGAEFFTNAGGTKQRGLEAAISSWIVQPNNELFLRGLRIATNVTWSHFRFDDYADATADYSGNKLTGVPGEVIVSSFHLLFPKQLSLYLQHNYTSTIPLNDANSVYAKGYHLLQGKIMYEQKIFKLNTLRLFGGVDNILNTDYSLGNDINAFGNRFFNAAMPRNYYLGLNFII